MELHQFIKLIGKRIQTVITVVILFLVIAVIFTFVQPFKYASETKILVIQNFPKGSDPYAISRSNQYLSSILARIVNTNLFYNEVMNSGFNIKKNYFPENVEKQIRLWDKTVSARTMGDSGLISIKVVHPDKYQSDQILRGVNHTLKNNHSYYHGLGDQVSIKTVDQPYTSDWPAEPNIVLNLMLALAFGVVFSFSLIYLFPKEKFGYKMFSSRENHLAGRYENIEDIDREREYDSSKNIDYKIRKYNASEI